MWPDYINGLFPHPEKKSRETFEKSKVRENNCSTRRGRSNPWGYFTRDGRGVTREKSGNQEWGCANRINNGRAVCDSHHVNEDTLKSTYIAAIKGMIEDAEDIMEAVKESARLVMEPENKVALEQVAQEIIGIQTAVLELHKAKQQRSVTAADYTAQISEYSQQMHDLEAQQTELQTAENRYSEVKLWLDNFAEHIQSGEIMNTDDGVIMKQLVDQIIVGDDGIEVHFKCGVVATHEYM